jgi:hypothetical protein
MQEKDKKVYVITVLAVRDFTLTGCALRFADQRKFLFQNYFSAKK